MERLSITNGYKQKSLKSEELSNDSYLFSQLGYLHLLYPCSSMFQLDNIPDRICGFNAWNRRTQNTFKAFYALNSTNSRKQYVHSILLHFSFRFIPYRECKDSDLTRYFQRFYALIFRQLSYILKYIVSGILGNDYGLYCRRMLYERKRQLSHTSRLVHRLQFNRIENIWLNCALQIFCQDTNMLTDVATLWPHKHLLL